MSRSVVNKEMQTMRIQIVKIITLSKKSIHVYIFSVSIMVVIKSLPCIGITFVAFSASIGFYSKSTIHWVLLEYIFNTL